MNDPNFPSYRGWNQPAGGGFGDGYPGLGNLGNAGGNPGAGVGGAPFFSGPPGLVNPTVLPQQGAGGAGTGTGTGKSFNIGDIKGIIDRMGGVDGVLNGIGKIQKLVASMQQMAPLLRLLIGKGGTATAAGVSTGKVKRRRSRRRTGGRKASARRRTGRR